MCSLSSAVYFVYEQKYESVRRLFKLTIYVMQIADSPPDLSHTPPPMEISAARAHLHMMRVAYLRSLGRVNSLEDKTDALTFFPLYLLLPISSD